MTLEFWIFICIRYTKEFKLLENKFCFPNEKWYIIVFHKCFGIYRDEDDDFEESEDSKQHKETSKRVTFALPDDEENKDTNILNVQKDSDEVKSSFEKRQEKVMIKNWRNFVYTYQDYGTPR